jgi:hypothetical protein
LEAEERIVFAGKYAVEKLSISADVFGAAPFPDD